MLIHTSVEKRGSVFTNGTRNEGSTTGVLSNEALDIMYHAGNSDELRTVGTPRFEIVPVHDGQSGQRNTPVELRAPPVHRLLQLLHPPLFNLVVAECLEIVGQRGHEQRDADLAQGEDEPLCRIVLVPDDGVAVVAGELVVEVVVAFAEGDEGGKDVVARRAAVVKRLLADPVRETVHAERGLLHKARAQNARVHQPSPPIPPPQSRNHTRKHPRREQQTLPVVPVLPHHHPVGVQVRHVRPPFHLRVVVQHHPPNVAEDQPAHDRVGVLGRVGPAVVRAVVCAPPADAALDCAGADKREEEAQRETRGVASMRPETVVAARDAERGEEVVRDAPDEGCAREARVTREIEAVQRNHDDEGRVEPVDFLVPVADRHVLVLDV